jgi:hypothetical protein
MTFVKSTEAYEAWLKTTLDIVPPDLKKKHAEMAADLFMFFRATFYRWCQLWPEICPELNEAPSLLAVGDLHVENFGTWRDSEARLVWGINDFDEVATMPFAIDLVRLAASAHLAIDAGHLEIEHKDACASLVEGYKSGLEAGGVPFVLSERHVWLSDLVALRDPPAFWKKFEELPEFNGRVPKEALRGIEQLMPGKSLKLRIAHRIAGLGSLGRQRFVAVAEFEGGKVCREAKALAPSAWLWAKGKSQPRRIRYQEALDAAVRAVDPFVRLKEKWIVRRLAPDCTRVELASVPKDNDKSKLLRAMGFETANVHVGSGRETAILRYLGKLNAHWLHEAAALMVKATRSDWEEWRAYAGPQSKPAKTGAPKKGKAKAKAAGS